MTPLQFYNLALNNLGAGAVKNILRVKDIRTLQRWTADPLTTSEESRSASQIERHRNLFEAMNQVGLGYACRGIVRYLLAALGDEPCPCGIAKPADTMVEEKLMDYELLSNLHAAIDSCESINDIKNLEREVCEEVGRTVARYIQDQPNRVGGCDD